MTASRESAAPARHSSGQPTGTSPAPSGAHSAAAGKAKGQSGGADPYSAAASDSESALLRSVRAYVTAIDRRDGRAACDLFAPEALRGIRLPKPGGGCAHAVQASIGFSANGEAAWQRTEIRRIGPVELDPQHPGEARVRATVVHRFNHHREPSIEDDLIYLRQRAGRWLVAKPSSTFYRAIGTQNVPLSALAPP